MPIYEYECTDCHVRFEALRSMGDADKPIMCKTCQGEKTHRVLSLCYSHGDSGTGSSSHSGCGSCSGGNCSNCRG